MIHVTADRCNPFTAGYVTVSLLADLTIHQAHSPCTDWAAIQAFKRGF